MKGTTEDRRMMRIKRIGAVLLAGILFLTGCGNSAVATVMRLTKAEGAVDVFDEGGQDISITEDMNLYSGYRLDTENKSYAWISLDQVKLVKMDEASDVELRKNGNDLELFVNSGSLFFHITEPLGEEESLNIRTSTMAIGIRGTCGWVHVVDENHIQVYILEGVVHCEAVDPSSGGKAEEDVQAGEMADLFVYAGVQEGKKCEILKKQFYESDIPDFVLEEVDPELLETALELMASKDSGETPSEEGGELIVPILELTEYDGFGMAKNGIMPVQKEGLWGAVNYRNEVIVPFEYTNFQAPDEAGNLVLINEAGYTLFDAWGNVLYQGEDPVRASGGMYIIRQKGEEFDEVFYYRLDGTLVQALPMEPWACTFNGFYDGISMTYRYSDENAAIVGEEEHVGYTYSTGTFQVGELDQNGEITWHEDPLYLRYLRVNEEILQEAIGSSQNSSGWEANAGGHSSYLTRIPLCTGNHGYYLAGNFELEPWTIAICNDNYELVGECEISSFLPDPEQGMVRTDDFAGEDNSFRSFYHDGAYYYNYGPNMVWIVGDKDVLVDFTLYPGMTWENADNRIVKAFYDRIYMSDEKYWLVQKGEMWGYIDHDGREAAMFEDASGFYEQYALVVEDGRAYLINEEFEKVQELGEADSVVLYGELFAVVKGGTRYLYQLR